MTRGQQIMAQLLTADIESGKVVLKGAELFLAGQKVEPLLTYETVGPAARSSVRLAEASPVAVREDDTMAIQFAALPQERLISTAQRQELLQDRARAAERVSVWQGNFAPLPPDDLLVSGGVEPTSPAVAGRPRPEPARSVFAGCAPLPRDPLTEKFDHD